MASDLAVSDSARLVALMVRHTALRDRVTVLERAIEKALVLIDRNENTDAEDILEKALEGE